MQDHLVVVGASRAGLFAVEGARRAGYLGHITLVGAEAHLPYDRPPLSKEFLTPADVEPQPPLYRSADALRSKLDVDVRTGTAATRVDPDARTVWLGDEAVTYTGLVIATGTTARRLPVPRDLDGVVTLRTLDDARRVRAGFETCPKVVVIGAGLIGSEVASAARKRGLPVTVVEPLPVPLSRVVGEKAGAACARLHEQHGTTLLTGVHVTDIKGSSRAEQVVLSDGTSLDADLVVVGIGVDPETGWLADSGLELANGLVCDATLSAGRPGVYGAGDIVRWFNPSSCRLVRLENWTSAAEQGRVAGRNAVRPSDAETYATVPYVWSDQYDKRLQFVGDAAADEVLTTHDSADEGSHLTLYRVGELLTGAFGINQPRRIPKLRKMISRGVTFDEAVRECTA